MRNRFLQTEFRQRVSRPRGIIAVGALLVLLSLLANSAGLAIFFAALVVPTALLLKQFEDEIDPSTSCCGVFLGQVNLDIRDAGALSIVAVGFVLPILAE